MDSLDSQDNPELPFTNEDYKKRRAHPNFKKHIDLMKLVVKMVSPKSLNKLHYLLLVASCLQWIHFPKSLSPVPEEEDVLHTSTMSPSCGSIFMGWTAFVKSMKIAPVGSEVFEAARISVVCFGSAVVVE